MYWLELCGGIWLNLGIYVRIEVGKTTDTNEAFVRCISESRAECFVGSDAELIIQTLQAVGK